MSTLSAPAYLKCVRPRGLFIGTATLMCLMILTTPDMVQAGKPKPPPPPPPVRYQVQLWTVPGAIWHEVLDTNNKLQSVGSIGVDFDGDGVSDRTDAFLYDPGVTPGAGVDLNDIVFGIPTGSYIRKATAINEVGQIAAYIARGESLNPTDELQAVVIDMNPTIPVLHVIPDRGFTISSNFGDINDWGDVVVNYRRETGNYGHYFYNVYSPNLPTEILGLELPPDNMYPPKINNAGVIVGHRNRNDGYRRSVLGVFEEFPGLRPTAINENGAFCGGATVTTTKPNRISNYAFVYDTSLKLNTIIYSATDLNGSLDSVVGYYWLNHRTLGNLPITDLLDPNDPNSSLVSANLSCKTMTDRREGTNFPALGGTTSIGGVTMGVHLIPLAP